MSLDVSSRGGRGLLPPYMLLFALVTLAFVFTQLLRANREISALIEEVDAAEGKLDAAKIQMDKTDT